MIDSDDLLEGPQKMVAAYCSAIGIPFIPEALSWEPGARDEVLCYDGNDDVWHASLRDSDGLKAIPRKPANLVDLPRNLVNYYEAFMGHYEALYGYRLQAGAFE